MAFQILLLSILLLKFPWLQASSAAQLKEIRGCYGDTIELTCPTGGMINVLHDYFGISGGPGCSRHGNPVCSIPTVYHKSNVRRICNGRTRCMYTVAEKHDCRYNGAVNHTDFQHVDFECIQVQSVYNMCQPKQWSTKSGYLQSPQYPQMYPKDMDCACRVSSNGTGSVVAVQTLEYHVTESTPCKDWLYVITEFSSEQLCGALARHFVGEDISLLFHTQTDGFKGFLLHYEALSPGTFLTIQCETLDKTKLAMRRTFYSEVEVQDDISQYFRHLATDDGVEAVIGRYSQEDQATEHILEKDELLPRGKTKVAKIIPKNNKQSKRLTRPRVQKIPASLFPDTEATNKTPYQYRPEVKVTSGCFGQLLDFKCDKKTEVLRIIDEFYGVAETERCTYKRGDCIVRAAAGSRVASQTCQGQRGCTGVLVARMHCKATVTTYQEVIYECVPGEAVYNMADTFSMLSTFGYLSTPGFPDNYPHNTITTCLISSTGDTPTEQIEVSVVHISLPMNDQCGDHLDIRRKNAVTRLCNKANQRGSPGRFRAPSILVNFISDDILSASGIWIHFRGLGRSKAKVQCMSGSMAAPQFVRPVQIINRGMASMEEPETSAGAVQVQGKVLHLDRSNTGAGAVRIRGNIGAEPLKQEQDKDVPLSNVAKATFKFLTQRPWIQTTVPHGQSHFSKESEDSVAISENPSEGPSPEGKAGLWFSQMLLANMKPTPSPNLFPQPTQELIGPYQQSEEEDEAAQLSDYPVEEYPKEPLENSMTKEELDMAEELEMQQPSTTGSLNPRGIKDNWDLGAIVADVTEVVPNEPSDNISDESYINKIGWSKDQEESVASPSEIHLEHDLEPKVKDVDNIDSQYIFNRDHIGINANLFLPVHSQPNTPETFQMPNINFHMTDIHSDNNNMPFTIENDSGQLAVENGLRDSGYAEGREIGLLLEEYPQISEHNMAYDMTDETVTEQTVESVVQSRVPQLISKATGVHCCKSYWLSLLPLLWILHQ